MLHVGMIVVTVFTYVTVYWSLIFTNDGFAIALKIATHSSLGRQRMHTSV